MTPDSENESGARPAYRRLRCLRCNVPSPDHPDSNKYGGVTMASRLLCTACMDYLGRKARIRALYHVTERTPSEPQQRTLTEGYNGE